MAMTDGNGSAPARGHEPIAPGALGAWWWQGLRSAFLRRPDWRALQTTPNLIACLVIATGLAGVAVERLYVDGQALFHWPALLTGWLGIVAMAWVCWRLVPRSDAEIAPVAPSAAALFSMLVAQSMTLAVGSALILVPMSRIDQAAGTPVTRAAWWAAWALVLAWWALAQLVLAWRSSVQPTRHRIGAVGVLLAALALELWLQPTRHWYPGDSSNGEAAAEPIKLTQELLELQPQILQARLQALPSGRPGIVDVYALTFAPYADEDVFRRESHLVATLMQERFGAAGRTVQLLNHRDTLRDWPWATPLNLQRAIQQVARVMNRDEDLLFIHLTSHGARAGPLVAEFWPLTVDPVTPQMLRGWLDDAGIRHRVISVSACYSGAWIAPLAGPDTLVMTAADAEHTSYGCGRGSPLTYFGRAMFDEQLRHTLSFEQAHAAARPVIEKREVEAGKRDGYSNPQIRVGERIRDRLARLEAELGAGAP